jgi:predicted nucleotide-binding protein
MANKFDGTTEELKGLIETAGVKGQWEDDGHGKESFRTKSNTVLNWWPSKGTINFQGSDKDKERLNHAIFGGSTSAADTIGVERVSPNRAQNIFIVHGHDMEARDQLELVLRRLGLEPYILMNSSGGGKTIIEALEGKIGRDFSSDFGIVLMTPDDVGYAKKDGPNRAEPRARQNVILETGMLLSSLTRERMAIVVKGHVEIPSDLQGIIRFGYNDHVREIVPKLCQRLKEGGFDLNPDQIASAAQ